MYTGHYNILHKYVCMYDCHLVAEKLVLPSQSTVPVNVCYIETSNCITIHIIDDEYSVRAFYLSFLLYFAIFISAVLVTKHIKK